MTLEFAAEFNSGTDDHPQQKPVVSHCTGGLRCAVATKHLQNCSAPACREQSVVCGDHAAETACSEHPGPVLSWRAGKQNGPISR
jgi:hypothetical protein